MIERRKDLILYRIERAHETLEDAHILAISDRWNACVNRLYYACFYAVSAICVSLRQSASHQKNLFWTLINADFQD